MQQSPIQHQTVHILETIVQPSAQLRDIFVPFAIDESLLHQLTQAEQTVFLHFWELTDTVILGMTDTKTPHLLNGVSYLQEQGFTPVVRHAGGLAVVSNPGVLNISLLFNHPFASINQVYEWMQELIQRAFPEAQAEHAIHAFEVSDSYCPGDYDLSIQGKKFAGIAQRRFKDAICVSIYLSVNGDQHQRGQLIRSFYDHSIKEEETRWHFPTVNPDSMQNLSDLLKLPLTIDAVKERILSALIQHDCRLVDNITDFSVLPVYQKASQRLQQRAALLAPPTQS